jgi:hypothetical protein
MVSKHLGTFASTDGLFGLCPVPLDASPPRQNTHQTSADWQKLLLYAAEAGDVESGINTGTHKAAATQKKWRRKKETQSNHHGNQHL